MFKLRRSYRLCDRKCVKMADFINFWENRINSFKNLLLQTHQSKCYQILVATLGQDRDVKVWRSCRSRDRKCNKMADFVNFWENRINSFKNIPLQTHQSECFQIWVTTLGQGTDKLLQVQWSYFSFSFFIYLLLTVISGS